MNNFQELKTPALAPSFLNNVMKTFGGGSQSKRGMKAKNEAEFYKMISLTKAANFSGTCGKYYCSFQAL